MPAVFSKEQEHDLLNRGFTRRSFGRLATLLSAGAALPFTNEFPLPQMSRARG